MKHPCNNRCSLGLGGTHCAGCGRSVQQVAEWASYSHEQKLEITKEIKNAARKRKKQKCDNSPDS